MPLFFAKLALGVFATLAAAMPSIACSQVADTLPGLTERDRSRLSQLDLARSAALGTVTALGGRDAEKSVLQQTLASYLPQGFGQNAQVGRAITGYYFCRVIKIGGQVPPLEIFGDFTCTISPIENGFRIVKTTGSQRLSGTLTPAGRDFAYKGARHYFYEGPQQYGTSEDMNQVGCLRRTNDPDVLVLEQPWPRWESWFDLIVLTRR